MMCKNSVVNVNVNVIDVIFIFSINGIRSFSGSFCSINVSVVSSLFGKEGVMGSKIVELVVKV